MKLFLMLCDLRCRGLDDLFLSCASRLVPQHFPTYNLILRWRRMTIDANLGSRRFLGCLRRLGLTICFLIEEEQRVLRGFDADGKTSGPFVADEHGIDQLESVPMTDLSAKP